MIKEHDRVVLKRDITSDGLKTGDVGTIVHVYAGERAYEVEFVALDGHTIAVSTVEACDVRPVTATDVTHARAIAQP